MWTLTACYILYGHYYLLVCLFVFLQIFVWVLLKKFLIATSAYGTIVRKRIDSTVVVFKQECSTSNRTTLPSFVFYNQLLLPHMFLYFLQ